MSNSGTDSTIFRGHSTRGATSSTAARAGLSVSDITCDIFRMADWLTSLVTALFASSITSPFTILTLAELFLVFLRLWTSTVILRRHLWSAITDCARPIQLQYKMSCTNKWRRDITMLQPSPSTTLFVLSLFFRFAQQAGDVGCPEALSGASAQFFLC